jgi:hypothetical protein
MSISEGVSDFKARLDRLEAEPDPAKRLEKQLEELAVLKR